MCAYRVIGIESSPYAIKVRAVMRYRRIPHHWVGRMPQFFAETAHVRPLLMPVVQFPDGEYRTDSTPIIRTLERLHNGREITPPDPVFAFLSDIIEDMADEWLTKILFHYRFSHDADTRFAAAWVMDDAHPLMTSPDLADMAARFAERQRSRMHLVGCTPVNASLLEGSFMEILAALSPVVATDRFLFGTRPSLADFGLFAQLHILGTDPTPRAVMARRAPRLWSWTGRVNDLSGIDGAWNESAGGGPATPEPAVHTLLSLAGRYYLPYLHAHTEAAQAGDEGVSVDIAGHRYEQPIFRYHLKCHDYLLHQYRALTENDRLRADEYLAQSGCLEYFAGNLT